jgi:hypothetical protein
MKCTEIILRKRNLGLIILPVKCKIMFNRKVEMNMNEVFETLASVFEELRSESGDRKYCVQTEDAKEASRELKAFEMYLSKLSEEDREFLEEYIDAVDHAHYKEEQRAYYQGFVDGIQVLDGLGIVKKRIRIKELLKIFER